MGGSAKETRTVPLEVWRWTSLLLAWGLGTWSVHLSLASHRRDAFWIWTAVLALAVACSVAGLLRIVILDFLSQFQYREKFALFLAHVIVLVSPMGIVGRGWLLSGFVLLLILTAVQLVNAIAFHRFLALSALLTVFGLWSGPERGAMSALIWAFLAAVFLIVKRVRFALEDVPGATRGVPVRSIAGVLAMYVVVPVVVSGLLAWWTMPPAPEPHPRPAETQSAHTTRVVPETYEVDLRRLVWQAVGLAGFISVLIATLYWYAARRNRERAVPLETEEEIARATFEEASPPEPEPELDPLEGKERRLEILRQFRRLERGLEKLDLPRRRPWTVREYVRRFAAAIESGTEPEIEVEIPRERDLLREEALLLAGLYEKARYALYNPSIGEVDSFRRAVDEVLERMREAARTATDPETGTANP